MDWKKIIRHIIGYAIGFSVFLLLIPWGLYEFSKAVDSLVAIPFIQNPHVRIAIAFPVLIVGLFFAAWSNI